MDSSAPPNEGADAGKAGDKKQKKKDAKAQPPVSDGPPPEEKTPEELAKMSKEERTAYHMARRAVAKAAPAAGSSSDAAGYPAAGAQLTKAQRRAIQESQRKVKEDKANASKEGDELYEELKLQGLSEDQAREVMLEMRRGETVAEAEDEEDDEGSDDLLGSVRMWMAEQEAGEVPADAIRDFNMKVRFQGHVDSTPPDHLAAILTVLVSQAVTACDLASASKFQPNAITKALTPELERWANLLRGLYEKSDVLEAIKIVVDTITSCVAASGAAIGCQECAVVGCIMAVRDLDDLVEDEDLLVGCKGVEPRTDVLDKYISFLEEAIEEDDEDDDEEDD